jgi:hypothetical protein
MMRRLSGDQCGFAVIGPPKNVTRTGLEPSRSHTQISGWPERGDSKAMCLPSGEACGFHSPRLEAIIRVARPAGLVGLVRSSRHMLTG